MSALVYFGEPVKVLSTHKREDGVEVATLGGPLALLTGPDEPDLEREFFTKETDFGTLSRKGAVTLPAYYQHGFDSHYRNQALTDADVFYADRDGNKTSKDDAFSVWAQYQLEVRTEYERHLLEMAREGKMGQSSGAVAHLVERQSAGKTSWLKTWPLGEASLTPTPAEPRTSAVPLKSLFPDAFEKQEQPTNKETAMSDQNKETADVKAVEDTKPEPKPEQKDGSAIDMDQITLAVAKAFREEQENAKKSAPREVNIDGAPAQLKSGRGDSEAKAFKAWVNGDDGAMKHAMVKDNTIEIKASNDTDMNITTNADGGHAVPTGHFNGIIARRDESMIARSVGARSIPGVGTTVNVPVDNEDDGEFVSTSEASDNDRDAPALDQVAMTLVKYTKRVELSDELLIDEESRLLAFLEDFIGRGMAKTHNSLLVTEVEANGSDLGAWAADDAVDAGKLEAAAYGEDVAYYLGEGAGGGSWIMRPPTFASIINLTGNDRLYATQVQGSTAGPTLLGYGVYFSNKVDAIGGGNKSVLFGNFNYVGYRDAPSFQVLRDPYSAAVSGQVRLHYFFRTVYKVLQSEAVGWIDHPTS